VFLSPPGRGKGVIMRNAAKPDWYALAWRLPMIAWQGLFFVGPLIFMFAMSFFLVKNYRMEPAFELANWTKQLGKAIFWQTYLRTLWLAVLATGLTSLIAFPASYFLSFKISETARRWAIFFLIIPFFTSYLVRIFAWQVILAQDGVINAVIRLLGGAPITMLNTPVGTMVGYLTLCLPLVVILQTFALANIDKRLVEAAHNLGCGRLRTVFTVIIPLAKTGLVVAAVFCFILSFGDFVAPYYLGGSKPPTLSIMIVDTSKSGQQWPRAAVVAPIIASFVFSFNSDRFPTIPLGHFTTGWYAKAFGGTEVWPAIRTSLTVAALTSVLATAIGFSAAYTDYRYKFFGKTAFLILALLPPTIPLIILALAMLGWLSVFHASGLTLSIIIAHTVLCAPFAMAVIRLRLNQMDPNLEPAAWNLGASEWRTMKSVIVPFTLPAIIAALCLTAAVSFDEFAVAWFVSGLNKTVPVVILEILTGNVDPQINAIGTFVFVVSMTLVVVAQVLLMTREKKAAPA
jgi:ABC-type spermidine/putrescine transport system permease subunit II